MGFLTDDFVRNGAIDHANNIPYGRCYIVLLVIEVHDHIIWCWANVILDSFVAKPSVAGPILVEIFSLWAMAIEGLQDWQGIQIGDGD